MKHTLNRRWFLACAAQTSLALTAPALLKAAMPAKPNILLILTDDEGWTTLSCYGIPGKLRVVYLARKRKCKLAGLEAGSQWNATFVSPIDGREYPVAQPVVPEADGTAAIPNSQINQDWVLVLQTQKSIHQSAQKQE